MKKLLIIVVALCLASCGSPAGDGGGDLAALVSEADAAYQRGDYVRALKILEDCHKLAPKENPRSSCSTS